MDASSTDTNITLSVDIAASHRSRLAQAIVDREQTKARRKPPNRKAIKPIPSTVTGQAVNTKNISTASIESRMTAANARVAHW